MIPADYLTAILSELAANPLIASFEVAEQWLESDRGYARVRARLNNGDFLELAEYFSSAGDSCTPERYRYQWMDATREVLRKRWDNVEHSPELPGFPHHVHLSDGRVEPSGSMSTLELLRLLATVIRE
jgi:hypothetical protein